MKPDAPFRDYLQENAMRTNQSSGEAFHQLGWHKERSAWPLVVVAVLLVLALGVAAQVRAERENPAASYVGR